MQLRAEDLLKLEVISQLQGHYICNGAVTVHFPHPLWNGDLSPNQPLHEPLSELTNNHNIELF